MSKLDKQLGVPTVQARRLAELRDRPAASRRRRHGGLYVVVLAWYVGGGPSYPTDRVPLIEAAEAGRECRVLPYSFYRREVVGEPGMLWEEAHLTAKALEKAFRR